MAEATEETTPPASTIDTPYRGDLVSNAALTLAASNLVKALPVDLAGRVLLTTDADLVASFALARQVQAAIADQLKRARDAAVEPAADGSGVDAAGADHLESVDDAQKVVDLVTGIWDSIVKASTPVVTTTAFETNASELELVAAVAAEFSAQRRDVVVISDEATVVTVDTEPLGELASLQAEVSHLDGLKKAAAAELAASTPEPTRKAWLEKRVASLDIAITTASAFITALLAPAPEGKESLFVTAVSRLGVDASAILVIQAVDTRVQQSTVSLIARAPEYVLDAFARIPYLLISTTSGAVTASGIATGPARFHAAFDLDEVRVVWTPIGDTVPIRRRSLLPTWLKVLAAVAAAFVLVAAFSLPLVVTDTGPAAGTDAALDRFLIAQPLTVDSSWQIAALVAPLLAALLTLMVRSGERAWPIAVGATALALAAGIVQATIFGLSHLVIYVGGAYLPAVLLALAAWAQYRRRGAERPDPAALMSR